MMECFSIVSYSVLVNGKPSLTFEARKRLRKDDFISPFLFTIEKKYLSWCMLSLHDNHSFHFHPRCKRVKLTHMIFADDLLLFCKADEGFVRVMIDQFNKFDGSSRLMANPVKCEVYFVGVNDDVQSQITSVLQMNVGRLPFKYLGVPLASRKIRCIECSPLIIQITRPFTHWTIKFSWCKGVPN